MADEKPTRKATLPPGTAKPDGPPKAVKPDGPPKAVKPAGPLKAVKPAGPPKAARPAGPPGSVKPAGPPKPGTGPARKPAMPPGATPAGLPGGDGAPSALTRKDFASDSDVRWCPGCGDYAVLAATQRVMPELAERRENVVFVSGIGCSSRFPYYMNTYGMHTIHGRAPTVAMGIKCANPDLDVWIVTGDGDALSIGTNHFAHLLRRNLDVQFLLFNNQIYGLTKGQYSPTSERGKKTVSTPYGSLDHPFNPLALALGAESTFVARTLDRDPTHMAQILRAAHAHKGTSFVEVYQNCNIFNDGAFFRFTEKDSKPHHTLFLEHGKPLVYDKGAKGLRLEGLKITATDLSNGRWTADDCLVHDETDRTLAGILTRIFWDPALPQPVGVFYREERATYEQLLRAQLEEVKAKNPAPDLAKLLGSGETWTIE